MGNEHSYGTKINPYGFHFGWNGKNKITNDGPVILYVSSDVMQFEDHRWCTLAKSKSQLGFLKYIIRGSELQSWESNHHRNQRTFSWKR